MRYSERYFTAAGEGNVSWYLMHNDSDKVIYTYVSILSTAAMAMRSAQFRKILVGKKLRHNWDMNPTFCL